MFLWSAVVADPEQHTVVPTASSTVATMLSPPEKPPLPAVAPFLCLLVLSSVLTAFLYWAILQLS